jgi:sulfite exporter TauE/SafE
MTALIATVLGASLLGSAHCVGMCGGLVGFYTGAAAGAPRRTPRLAHLAYNGGRLAAYATLGAAAGALGAALDTTGGLLLGIQRSAAILSGGLITLWGLGSLLEALGVRVLHLGAPAPLRSVAGRAIASVGTAPPLLRALVVGLATGCLPCGWLYAFLATAAGTGSALGGAALMAVFWVGTLPAMLSLGLGLQALAGPLRRHVPVACAMAMIVVGLLAIGGRMSAVAPGPGSPAHEHHARH